MERITNEHQANEICKRHIFDSNHFACCMEAMQWKDGNLKNYLKGKAMRYAGCCASQNSLIFNIYNEIFTDLFGEPIINQSNK